MLNGNKEDIYGRVDNYLPITLFGDAIKVGVIGGGKAAFLKSKSFIKKGAMVEILSRDFCEEIKSMSEKNLSLIEEEYSFRFINDKHLIIIAINEKTTIDRIICDCNSISKIYINSHDFKEGMGVVPVSRESENVIISINSKVGNPKGSLMVVDKAINVAREYDEFISYSSKLRDNIKKIDKLKSELLNFIISEDFKFFYELGVDRKVLNLFYDESLVNNILSFDNEVY
ncbi:MAG: NAD(P)-dependent oxidoreductase [Clostridium sp.]